MTLAQAVQENLVPCVFRQKTKTQEQNTSVENAT